jgi:hypothetical protein
VSVEPLDGTGTDLSFTASTGVLVSSSGENATIPAAGGGTAFGLMTGARADKLDALPTNAALTAALEDKADAASTVSISAGAVPVYLESSDPEVARPLVGGVSAPFLIYRNPQGPILNYSNALPQDLQIDLWDHDLRQTSDPDIVAWNLATQSADIAAGQLGAMDYRVWNARVALAEAVKELFTSLTDVTFVYGYGAKSVAGSLIPMIGTAPLFNSLEAGSTFIANGEWRGVSQTGTRRYINTGVNLSAFPADDVFLGVYRTALPPSISLNQMLIGAQNSGGTGNGAAIMQTALNDAMFFRSGQANAGVTQQAQNSLGLLASHRVSSGSFSAIYDGDVFPLTSAISGNAAVDRYVSVLAVTSEEPGILPASAATGPGFLSGSINSPSLSTVCAYLIGPGSSITAANLAAIDALIASANATIDQAVSEE